MLKPTLSRSRSDLQLLYHSRLLSRQTGILLNALPKSGTHFFKAVLEGMGYGFHGHFGSRSVLPVRLAPGAPGFQTAHTRRPVPGSGAKFLTVRDPVEVSLSLVHYSKRRKDHYLHAFFRDRSVEDAVAAVFSGHDAFNPLADRYASMMAWADKSDASVLDFADFRGNPDRLTQVLGHAAFDPTAVKASLDRWNPTKRVSDKAGEEAFLDQFRHQHRELIAPCYSIYDRARSLRRYDL